MSNKWHGGKGDKPRKTNNQKQYADNYDKIFGKKPVSDETITTEITDNKPVDKVIDDTFSMTFPDGTVFNVIKNSTSGDTE